MMQAIRRGIILGVLLAPFSKLFAATPKPNLVPSKVGQSIVWRGRKYTAIKSGKKIIWDNGIPILNTTPSNTNQSAKPSASSTPVAEPKIPIVKNETPVPSQSSKKILNIVGKSSDLQLGETKVFKENDPYGRGARYIITRTKNGLVAYDNTCTHEGCGIELVLPNNQLRCGCHGAEFDAISGAAIRKPAYDPLRSLKVSEVDGEILIG